MLRLRLMDVRKQRDWMPDRLLEWTGESVADLDADLSVRTGMCFEARYCDYQFRRFLDGLTDEKERRLLAFGYKLGTLWDLIKVVSYQDLSAFKRVWAFIEAWKLKKGLERDLSNL